MDEKRSSYDNLFKKKRVKLETRIFRRTFRWKYNNYFYIIVSFFASCRNYDYLLLHFSLSLWLKCIVIEHINIVFCIIKENILALSPGLCHFKWHTYENWKKMKRKMLKMHTATNIKSKMKKDLPKALKQHKNWKKKMRIVASNIMYFCRIMSMWIEITCK